MANEPTGMLAYIIAGREVRCTNAHAKCLLQYYCSNVGKDGTFFKSTLDICAETCLSESYVRKANARWKALGLLSWVEESNLKKKANVYTIDPRKLQTAAKQSKGKLDTAKVLSRLRSADRSKRYRAKHHHAQNHTVTPQRHAPSRLNVTSVTPSQGVYEPKHEPICMNQEHESPSPLISKNQEQEGKCEALSIGSALVTPSQTVTPEVNLDFTARFKQWSDELKELGARLI